MRTRPDEPRTREIQSYMTAGQLVPAPMMRDLVNARLAAPDCKALGFILEIARRVGRGARSTDTPERAAERLRVYHAAMHDLADWYPASLVVRVDAERSPDDASSPTARSRMRVHGIWTY